MSKYQVIAFIANAPLVKQDVTLPYNLGNGYFLRRANSKEVDSIKGGIKNIFPDFKGYLRYYEHSASKDHYDPDPVFLNEDEWRYFVISFESEKSDIRFLRDIGYCLYLNFKIILPVYTYVGTPGINYTSRIFFPEHELGKFYREAGSIDFKNPIQLTESKLSEFKEMFSLYCSVKEGYSFIAESIQNFWLSYQTPSRSSIKVIELFSIIELLISHKPVANDSYDTINKQLRNKLNLINNRLGEPINVENYFKVEHLSGRKERPVIDRLIQVLYDYRSNVAHGAKSDFKGELKVLIAPNNVIEFLEQELIPKLLQFALREPQLVLDLKLC